MKTPVFQDIRTRRLKVTLDELTIGQAIALARLPNDAHELSTTAFLKCAVKSVSGVGDISGWTVQERILAVCQYLSACAEHADFELNNDSHYSDYLDADNDVRVNGDGSLKTVTIGDIAGDIWTMRYLTGGMAESIERLQGEVKTPDGDALSGYAHWELGCMAAQLVIDGGDGLGLANEGLFDELLVQRMQVFLAYPQSVYEQLRLAFYSGMGQLNHLFKIGLSGTGIVVLPREVGGTLPPARFRPSALLCASAKIMVG